MAPGRLIWSLRLFVLFFLVCEVRCSTGTRNCNITAICRLRRKFFSRVIHYRPNRDAGYNPCEIPLDCIHLNPGPLKNPCVNCKRAIVDSNSNFTLNGVELQSRNICSRLLVKKSWTCRPCYLKFMQELPFHSPFTSLGGILIQEPEKRLNNAMY